MRLAAALMVAGLALAGTSRAAEVVFPPGSRIGLVPPVDMHVSQRFAGFETHGPGAVITAVEMPPQAFDELSAGLTADNLKKQGLSVRSRETFKVAAGEALLLEGDQAGTPAVRKWLLVVKESTMTAFVIGQELAHGEGDTSRGMREALKTVAIREPRALDEQVSALPFRLGDMGGFRAVRVMSGNSILLTDGPDDVIREVEQPMMVVAHAVGGPPRDQRDALARAALRSNNTLRDVVLERAQGFRQRGSDWHEIVAKATDVASGRPVIVTQVLRFAPDHYIRVLGMARIESRDEILSRFRAVADAIEPK
jgi:hypothetical protein